MAPQPSHINVTPESPSLSPISPSAKRVGRSVVDYGKFLSIHDIAAIKDEHFFVVNLGPHRTLKKTDIRFAIGLQDNTVRQVHIPDTWIPFDISTIIPKKHLIENLTLMDLVRKGWVGIVSTAKAKEILLTQKGQIELKRLAAMMNPGMEDAPSIYEIPEEEGTAKVSPGQITNETEGVNPVVVEAIKRTDLSAEDRLSMLQTMAPAFTNVDVAFIIRNTDNDEILALCPDIGSEHHG